MMLAHTVHDAQMLKRHPARQPRQRRRQRVADAGRGEGLLPAARASAATCATRSSARRCSAAAAPRATTPSPGATRARPTRSASTSSRTARSPASAATRTARSRRSRRRAASIRTSKVGVVAAGQLERRDAHGRRALPLESFPLQALVSEPVKPVFPCVVMSNAIHAYISQSDKGELVIGAGTDAYTSYTQRGALHVDMHTLEAICELFPLLPAPADAAQLGRHRRRDGRPLADHRPDAGAGPVRELRLGHGRLQGDAGLRPRVRLDRWRRASRTRSRRRSRSSASATGR